jgi:hypothetical protein
MASDRYSFVPRRRESDKLRVGGGNNNRVHTP